MQPNDQNPVDQDSSTPNTDSNTPPTAPEAPVENSDTTAPEAPSVPEPQVITPTQTEDATPAEPETPVEAPEAPVQAPEAPVAPEAPEAPAEPVASPVVENPGAQAAAGAAVAGATVAAVANSEPTEAPKKSRKKLKLLIIGIVVALLLVAGTAGAYFGVYLPNQPQKIVGDALSNTVNTEKFKSTKFEGEISFSGGEISNMLSSVSFEGGADTTTEAVDFKVTLNTAVTKVNLDVRSTDGKSMYLKLSGLSGLDKLLAASGSDSAESAAFAQFLPLLTQVNDQWFVIDESLIKQIPGAGSVQTEEKLSSEDAQRIGDIYKKHQFINIDKRLGDQDIHGVASYHVQSSINKDQLKAFLGELKSANIKGLTIEQSDIDALNDVDFSKYPFDVWVSKKDRFITQLSTSFEDNGTKATIRVALKDINKEVKVEKPENAKSVLELLGGLSQLGGGTATDTPALLGL